MQTAAHTVPPNFAEVGRSTEKPPTSLAHSGLDFVGTAGTVREFSQTADHCCYILQYCRHGSAAATDAAAAHEEGLLNPNYPKMHSFSKVHSG